MKKILIANRGEIACRVIRTAQKMGIRTVAVYSEIDRHAPHVRQADEAVCIGPAPSVDSYLRTDKILAAAKKTGADGIHPGYGFLSENAAFAKEVTDAGIIFIGPKPHAIEIMGSKLAAKEAVASYDIPMVPGTDKAVTDVEAAIQTAEKIGFPILVKASAGGGGKGMRIVENREEFRSQMDRAISEAESAFGDGAVFIEKYVSNPRHIEFQILADDHGNIVHLFERECSIQRRHQKVIEEAPSVLLTPEVRTAMGEAAVRVAKACEYTGAGTVEFLVDRDLNFYFLEMNTRLQVEHPVTELITGLDLVEQQILIARGEKLSFQQEDLGIKGHALELRVYAESPEDNFMPSTGKLAIYKRPEGTGVRLDDGYEEGMEIPIFYDPMIAKLITYGDTRLEAMATMINAIGKYTIEGVSTTLPFGRFVLEHEAFRSGNFDTGFVKKYYTPEGLKEMKKPAGLAAANFVLKHFLHEEKRVKPAKQDALAAWNKKER
ncbi:MAG: acetyl-CoA carboxylase biotin carboxylase subunit [Saprospiraceae bacterium]|nr:acetyl-CoA carboxylase biotin carboxylase subunit [Saprospiraceae bacterium]